MKPKKPFELSPPGMCVLIALIALEVGLCPTGGQEGLKVPLLGSQAMSGYVLQPQIW